MEYRLQISMSPQFLGELVADINVGNNFYCNIDDYDIDLYPETQYYWRIMDSDGIFSSVNTIRTSLETNNYKIELSGDNFVTKIIDTPVTGLQYSLPQILNRSSAYKWRVSGAGKDASVTNSFVTRPELAAPSQANAVLLNQRIIRVSWGRVNGASSYRVHYKNHVDGLYDGTGLILLSLAQQSLPPYDASTSFFDVNIANLSDPQNPFLDLVDTMPPGNLYLFYVEPCDEEGATTGTETFVAVVTREIFAPTNVLVYSLNRKMTVSWDPSTDAAGYRIYYKTHADGDYDGNGLKLSEDAPILGPYVDIKSSELVDIYHPSISFVNATFGTSYWFAVETIDAGNQRSSKAETMSGFEPQLAAPLSVDATYANDCFTISWERDPLDILGAGFIIYYKTNSNSMTYSGTGLKLDSPTGAPAPSPIAINNTTTSLNLYGMSPGTPYWFAVAMRDTLGNISALTLVSRNITAFPGQVPEELTRSPGNIDLTVNQITKQIKITWEPVA